MKIAVAASGGVDSLYVLAALQEQGHEVVAVHGRFIARPETQVEQQLARICDSLGLDLQVVDLQQQFQTEVIAPYLARLQAAQTPNPCASCNQRIKFGLFRDLALSATGAQHLATGHYVRFAQHPHFGPALRAGADSSKDQSYFLALTPIQVLQTCLFPLGDLRKTEVRQWLASRGLSAPCGSESQEICFVPGHYHDFLRGRNLALPLPGPIRLINPDGSPGQVLGKHLGLWAYTEGQRKGLNLAWKEPLFVQARDMAANTLWVAPKAQTGIRLCNAAQLNVLVPQNLWPQQLLVRSRYRQQPMPAEVEIHGSELRIQFHALHDPIAPGQVAAVYDADGHVLAGAIFQ